MGLESEWMLRPTFWHEGDMKHVCVCGLEEEKQWAEMNVWIYRRETGDFNPVTGLNLLSLLTARIWLMLLKGWTSPGDLIIQTVWKTVEMKVKWLADPRTLKWKTFITYPSFVFCRNICLSEYISLKAFYCYNFKRPWTFFFSKALCGKQVTIRSVCWNCRDVK